MRARVCNRDVTASRKAQRERGEEGQEKSMHVASGYRLKLPTEQL
mgnify:CR=1 FL=1